MSCLRINVYNGERYRLSLRSFLATSDVPTVEQVNRNESVVLGRGIRDRQIFGFDIHLGESLEGAVLNQSLTEEDLLFIVMMFQSKNYLVVPNMREREISVSFRKNCTDIDFLKGYFHAILAAAAIGLSMNDALVGNYIIVNNLYFITLSNNNYFIKCLDTILYFNSVRPKVN